MGLLTTYNYSTTTLVAVPCTSMPDGGSLGSAQVDHSHLDMYVVSHARRSQAPATLLASAARKASLFLPVGVWVCMSRHTARTLRRLPHSARCYLAISNTRPGKGYALSFRACLYASPWVRLIEPLAS